MNEPLDPGPTETRQHWQIVQQLREKLADIEARTMTVIAERDTLQRWKDEALTVESWWARVDAAVRVHPDTTLGCVVADEALRFIQERDKAIAERDNLRELLRNECENFDGECAGTCDSFSHDEDCRFCTFANDHRGLKKELAEARHERDNLHILFTLFQGWLDSGSSIKRAVKDSPTIQFKNGECIVENLFINGGEPTP